MCNSLLHGKRHLYLKALWVIPVSDNRKTWNAFMAQLLSLVILNKGPYDQGYATASTVVQKWAEKQIIKIIETSKTIL